MNKINFYLYGILRWLCNIAFSIFAIAILMQSFTFQQAMAEDVRGPYILGVGIHHGTFIENPQYQVEDTYNALQQYRFQSLRDDFGWSFMNGMPTATFASKLGRLRSILERTLGKQVPVLAITNGYPNHNSGKLPTTEEAQRNYAVNAGKIAEATRRYNPILEVWNEWNLGTGTTAHEPGNPEDYVRLLEVSHPFLRAGNPNATILVGGMGTDLDPYRLGRDWLWTRAAINAGMLDYGDGLSVHFYNICQSGQKRTPSEMIGRLERLDALLHESRTGGYPIYITEVGWPNAIKTCGYNKEEQISFSSQFLFWVTAFPSVKGVWLYELKDNGTNIAQMEHQFGLLDHNYQTKPYICGVQESWALLSGAKLASAAKWGEGAQTFEFIKGKSNFSALWAVDEEARAFYTVPQGKTARFICEPHIFKATDRVTLRTRPLIVMQE